MIVDEGDMGLDLRLSSAIAKQRSLCAELLACRSSRFSPFEPFSVLGPVGRDGGPLPAIDLGLIGSVVQPLRRAADLAAIDVTAALRERVFPGVIQTRNRSGPACRLVGHGSLLSRFGASGTPVAVQNLVVRQIFRGDRQQMRQHVSLYLT